jgi:hypothetical protein
MRIYVRGPHLGPVRTTLWSSGSSSNGGCLALFLAFGLSLGIVALGAFLVSHWQVTLIAAGVVALLLAGRYGRRRERAQAAAKPETPESPAAQSDRR